MSPTVQPRYATVEQAATILGLAPKTIRRRIAAGEIPARRFGPRAMRIHLDDLSAYAEAHEVEPEGVVSWHSD